MSDLVSSLSSHTNLWIVATALSAALFIGTLIAIPIIFVRLPTDFFTRPIERKATWRVALQTTTAVLLIIMGMAMLVLPGQGILTILIGLSLLDFPAKRAWQRRLLRRPTVLATINGIRKRAGKPPIET